MLSASWWGLTVLACLGAMSCQCRRAPPEPAYQAGLPLEKMPVAKRKAITDYLPAGAPLVVLVKRPQEVLAQIRASEGLARLTNPQVLTDLALSDTGATARALRQRLNDLSRLPFPGVSLEVLLDGPLALAARDGAGHGDFLMVKQLSPVAAASWKLAQMLQGVLPSLHEVNEELYRGFGLRKVLVDRRRRITYFVMRDLLVLGTNDSWVKKSLDLALGDEVACATEQPAVREALATEGDAALVAIVDSEALGGEPGRPGLPSIALLQTRWLQLSLRDNQGLTLKLAPLPNTNAEQYASRIDRSLVSRFAPHTTVMALARTLDLPAAVGSLLASAVAKNSKTEIDSLREQLSRTVVPTLGQQVFWFSDGVDLESDQARAVARHVVGIQLRDATAFAGAWRGISTAMLAPPLTTERERTHEIVCAAQKALCMSLVDQVLLVSNRVAALKTALAVYDGRAPSLSLAPGAEQTGNLLLVNARDLASVIARSAAIAQDTRFQVEPNDLMARAEPILAVIRDLGVISAELYPNADQILTGKIHRREKTQNKDLK